jgi:hypothetical protein
MKNEIQGILATYETTIFGGVGSKAFVQLEKWEDALTIDESVDEPGVGIVFKDCETDEEKILVLYVGAARKLWCDMIRLMADQGDDPVAKQLDKAVATVLDEMEEHL